MHTRWRRSIPILMCMHFSTEQQGFPPPSHTLALNAFICLSPFPAMPCCSRPYLITHHSAHGSSLSPVSMLRMALPRTTEGLLSVTKECIACPLSSS